MRLKDWEQGPSPGPAAASSGAAEMVTTPANASAPTTDAPRVRPFRIPICSLHSIVRPLWTDVGYAHRKREPISRATSERCARPARFGQQKSRHLGRNPGFRGSGRRGRASGSGDPTGSRSTRTLRSAWMTSLWNAQVSMRFTRRATRPSNATRNPAHSSRSGSGSLHVSFDRACHARTIVIGGRVVPHHLPADSDAHSCTTLPEQRIRSAINQG